MAANRMGQNGGGYAARGWLTCALLFGACMVSDFDRLREREPTVSRDGAACRSDGEDDGEMCSDVSALDASVSEPTESDPDAASGDLQELHDAAEPAQDAASDSGLIGIGPSGAGSGDADAAMCIDLVSDPKNCGHCGVDCSASFARVNCESSRCVRACQDGYDDCNNDLVLGTMGNGCERHVDNDVKNCGECRRGCVAPIDGFATCEKQMCFGQHVVTGAPATSPIYGSATGGAAFQQLCPSGQVLVGIGGKGDSLAYGIGAICAPLKATQAAGVISITTGTPFKYTPVGGIIDPEPRDYELLCTPGSFVTGIAGTLWIYPGATPPSVRTLTITCGSASVGAGRKISISSGANLSIGTPEAMPLMSFSRPCPAPSAVTGVSGRAGAYIDGLSIACAQLTIFSEPVGSVSVAE